MEPQTYRFCTPMLNEFKDMQLTWKILIVFYQSLNEDKD